MKNLKNGLKKLLLLLVFSLVVLCQSYSLDRKEKEYIITESQLQTIEQNNLTIQNELEELKKQQKAQIEYSKKLENEKEELQKEIEKEKKKKKILINTIPVVLVVSIIGGVCIGCSAQ